MNTSKFDYSKMSRRERKYCRIMESRYLVLNLLGAPGLAKSAILKSIADKIGAEFIDLRLPTQDETDLGVFPYLRDAGAYKVNSHAIPEWADQTRDTSKTFIIAFEELNRASKSVRDAALGVLLERRIGPHFIFGPNVLMCATGNLGTEDGTEVEELDTALKSRLITVSHDLKCDEWMDSWARINVHPDIIRYLEANPTHFYPDIKKQDQDGRVIVNPRTWTGLSEFIKTHYGMKSTVKEYGDELNDVGKEYIGSMSMQFLKWLRDHQRITMKDVLDGKVKDFKIIERENLNEIASELKQLGILNIEKKPMGHVIKLLRSIDSDIMYGAVWDIWQSEGHSGDFNPTEGSRLFHKEFKEELRTLVKRNQEANATEKK